ncbi:MAG: hypothetical protein WCJ97_11905 [Phycisphaerae bacterium]
MQNGEFYVRSKGRITGPFTVEILQKLVKRGVLSRVDEISSDRSSWARAVEYEDLFPAQQTVVPSDLPAEQATKKSQVAGEPSYESIVQAFAVATDLPTKPARYVCSICREMFAIEDINNDNGTMVCKHCASENTSRVQQGAQTVSSATNAYHAPKVPAYMSGHRANIEPYRRSNRLIMTGYICAVGTFVFFPLGVVGAIFGIINIVRGYVGHGIAQLVTSVVCMLVAIIFGVVIFMLRLPN